MDDSEKSKLREELQQCTSLPTAAKMIEENLLVKMSKGMACNPEDINTSKPLHSFGVDSLVAVEVRNWLFKELKSGMVFPKPRYLHNIKTDLFC